MDARPAQFAATDDNTQNGGNDTKMIFFAAVIGGAGAVGWCSALTNIRAGRASIAAL